MKCAGCERHYAQCECDRVYAGQHVGKLPDRILDTLDYAGCPMSARAIAVEVGGKLESVGRALVRLKNRGLVSVTVEMLGGRGKRAEWRLA